MNQALTETETETGPATEADINDWLERLRQGDALAATAIYRGYYGCVMAFVGLYVTDASAAEEIVQDTFLAAFDQSDRFQGRSSFKTWLLAIAKNKSRDAIRRAKREPAAIASDDVSILDQLVDQGWPALEQIAAKQLGKLIAFCLKRLPLAQREVTYFVFYEEMSLEQVAHQVSCPPGTVKSRLFHARLKLADCLKRRLDGQEAAA